MKHEAVTLVVLAYIIGFTTAYIAFGINYNSSAPEAVAYQQTPTKGLVSTEVKEDGFYALVDSYSRVLSAQAIDSASDLRPGQHYTIASNAVSDDGRFIAYCAQETLLHECRVYIYSVDEDLTRAASHDGAPVVLPEPAAQIRWDTDGILYVATYHSEDSNTPWYVHAHD